MKTHNLVCVVKVLTFFILGLPACAQVAIAQTSKNKPDQKPITIPDSNIVQLTVKYNALTGKLVIPKPVKTFRFFLAKRSIYANFKITNINSFYNNISIKVEQKSIAIDVPAKFLSMLGDEKKVDTSTKKASFDLADKQLSFMGLELGNTTSFNNKISSYLSTLITYQKLIALNDFLEPQIKKQLTIETKKFKNEIKQSTINYAGLTNTDTLNVEKTLSNFSSSTYKSLITDYGELKTGYENQSKKKLNSTLKSAANKKDGSITISIVKDSIDNNPYKEVFAYITTVYNKLLDEKTKNDYQQKIDKGIQLYQAVQNESFEIVTKPQLVDDEADYTDFTLNLGNTIDKTTQTISPIRIYQSGGLKIDFSTGIAFGLAGAKDHSYSLQQPDTSSLIIRQNKNYNQFFSSVAAFIHVYGRDYDHSILPALTFGISTNPAGLEQTSFYAGGSLMFRNSMLKRIIISGGLAAANVNYLKNTYQTDYTYTRLNFKNYTNLKALKDEDLVERKFRTGWFLSVSYNLSKK